MGLFAEFEEKKEAEKGPPQHVDQNHRQLRSESLAACSQSMRHGVENV